MVLPAGVAMTLQGASIVFCSRSLPPSSLPIALRSYFVYYRAAA